LLFVVCCLLFVFIAVCFAFCVSGAGMDLKLLLIIFFIILHSGGMDHKNPLTRVLLSCPSDKFHASHFKFPVSWCFQLASQAGLESGRFKVAQNQGYRRWTAAPSAKCRVKVRLLCTADAAQAESRIEKRKGKGEQGWRKEPENQPKGALCFLFLRVLNASRVCGICDLGCGLWVVG
jgi:hypothetical protein